MAQKDQHPPRHREERRTRSACGVTWRSSPPPSTGADPANPYDSNLGNAVLAASEWVGPVVSTVIVFQCAAPARFARFPGSAWRGAFGHSLKRLVCAMHLRPCAGCPLRPACVFPQIFEPSVPPDAPILANYRVAPTTFVLDPPETSPRGWYDPADSIPVTLRLFGRITRFGPYALKALLDAAAGGIGPDRASLVPRSIAAGLPSDAAAAPAPFTPEAAAAALVPASLAIPAPATGPVPIFFHTPLRLRVRNDLVTPDRFRPAQLLGAALRRVSLVSLLFGSVPPISPAPDYRALAAAAENLIWHETPTLHWVETTRRSARQQATMQIGGIVGRAALDLSAAPSLWPFLWLGQWLHVGKGTSMGFGRYRLGPAP